MLSFVEVAELWPKIEASFLGLSSSYVIFKDGGTADTPPRSSAKGRGIWHLHQRRVCQVGDLPHIHVIWTGHWILASFLIDPVPFLASKRPRTEFLIETWRGRIFTLKEVNILQL